jgi:hypothetical protein
MSVTKWIHSSVGRTLCALVAIVYATAVVGIPGARAQAPAQQQQQQALPADYRVGPGDAIFLAVPQRTDLNKELIVDQTGNVTLPLIGKVMVRGMTDSEIEARLLQALREYYPSVNRVEATITRASSNVIWVSGEVKLPGKYSFSQPVNVWEAIREAGGPTPTAPFASSRTARVGVVRPSSTYPPRWNPDRSSSCPGSTRAIPSSFRRSSWNTRAVRASTCSAAS